MTSVLDFARAKTDARRISLVTAYDTWTARLVARSSIDAILVGDSVAMVVHGHDTTVSATVPMMALHTRAVARGADGKFIVADLPFLSCRQGIVPALAAVGRLMRSGAHAVKLEGVDGHEDVIRQIVGSGIPVMGHLGLTPQSVHHLGGFRVQGRGDEAAAALLDQAVRLEQLGCFAVVLECVPAALAARITARLTIPTIGIGAGAGTDGQVLVVQDLWGVDQRHTPRFVRHFCDGERLLLDALDRYDGEVKAGGFPAAAESYT